MHPRDETYQCGCRTRFTDGDSICNSDECINRSTKTECIVGSCSKARCRNKRFQLLQSANVALVDTPGKGRGLRAQERIEAGEFIIEYVGEVIGERQFRRRMRDADDDSHFYVMKLGAREYIDAGQRGGLARFINHSCDPNCATQTWDVAGEQRIGIFSHRAIEKGEEVTYDYQWQRRGFRPTVCRCGAASCKGYLGGLDTRKVPVGQWALPAGGKGGEGGGKAAGEALLGEWVDLWLVGREDGGEEGGDSAGAGAGVKGNDEDDEAAIPGLDMGGMGDDDGDSVPGLDYDEPEPEPEAEAVAANG